MLPQQIHHDQQQYSEADRMDDEEKLVNAHIECFQEESTLMKKEAVLITEIE
jgi:hypothetical protein